MSSRAERFTMLALVVGCQQQPLSDQAHYTPLEASAWFDDGASARERVPGTIPDGHLAQPFALPDRMTREDLELGQRDYGIHCVPCHGRLGDGDGMVVRRGYPRPEPLSSARLREASLARLMEVIGEDEGTHDYADLLDPLARWRVAEWVRVLQLSAHVPLAYLRADERARLAVEPGAAP